MVEAWMLMYEEGTCVFFRSDEIAVFFLQGQWMYDYPYTVSGVY